jgi:hypothetical protein
LPAPAFTRAVRAVQPAAERQKRDRSTRVLRRLPLYSGRSVSLFVFFGRRLENRVNVYQPCRLRTGCCSPRVRGAGFACRRHRASSLDYIYLCHTTIVTCPVPVLCLRSAYHFPFY